VERTLEVKQVPQLAMLSATSFLVMMFNIPIPGGTTAHAVGAVLIAILLGPWAAVIAVSITLLFQALLFGDGGLLSYGANALNMAVIMTFVGFGAYRLLAAGSVRGSRRDLVAAGVGAYLGINACALATAVELGVQPDLFHDAAGAPLYSPYHLSQTLPVIGLAHLTVAGLAEVILTVGVLAYLVRTAPVGSAAADAGSAADARRGRRPRPAVVAALAMGSLVLLTPLGLLAPGGAFGEDAPKNLPLGRLGLTAVPSGMRQYTDFWRHSVLAGYGSGTGQNQALGYVLSAAIGILVVGLASWALAWLLGRALGRRAEANP
jgi:cobalt/nickel transport system permease protein